jgi:hypothetical protein
VTFTMTSAGSPEIQNWIPIEHLGTGPLAAWEASLVVAIFMAVTGYIWLRWMLAGHRARRNLQRAWRRSASDRDATCLTLHWLARSAAAGAGDFICHS